MIIKQILFLIPPRLGDALMLSPALALLKKIKPEYRIDILSLSPLSASVFMGNPNCGRVSVAAEIKDIDNYIEPYDLLVAPHRDAKILKLTEHLRKPLLLTEPANLEEHQAQQALNFIQTTFSDTKLGATPCNYELFPGEQDKAYIDCLLSNSKRKFIGIHLGCHAQNKKNILSFLRKSNKHEKVWPLRKFVALTKALKQKYPDYSVVLTGGENELNLAKRFQKHIPESVNLVGKTNVPQLAVLMQRLSLYVCPDTGTMHVACAMKTPMVALFGPTSVIRTGPFPAAAFRKVVKTDNLLELEYGVVLSEIERLLEVS